MVIILISCMALLIFLLSVDFSWSNVVSSKRNDLIFEGRNHDYGAYVLRREHHINVFYSLLGSIVFFGALLFTIHHFSKPAITAFKQMTGVMLTIPTMSTVDDDEKPKEQKKALQKTAASSAGASNAEYRIVEDNTAQVAKSDKDLMDKQYGDGNDTGEIQNPIETGCLDCDGTGKDEKPDSVKVDTPETWVPEMPEFPGGAPALAAYLNDRVKYSPREQELGTEGTIFIGFTVSAAGNVYDVAIERSIIHGDRLAQKAVEAVRAMPQWKPGKRGKKTVPVRIVIPLKFELKK